VKSRAAFIFWGAAAVEALLITFWHASGTEIAAIVCIVAVGIVSLQVTTLPQLPRAVPADSELWSLPAPELDLTLVTPSHNGAVFLADSLATMQESLKSTGLRYEIIVVSDGSTDGTPDLVRSLQVDDLRLVDYERRQGKGEALRRGMMKARGEYVAFIDSDGDLHPRELRQFLTLMGAYKPDIILGSKRHPLSQVSYPPLRRLMSRTYQLMLRVLFGLKVRDTQTGIKMLRREVLADILPRMVEKRFAFDLELLVVAKQMGYSRFFEAPVSIDYKFRSTVAARPVARILLDTAAIWYRRYILRFYSQGRRPTAPTPAGGLSEAPISGPLELPSAPV
jgi:glycosyltransferase involved in cell wall biosynthesis